MGILEILRFIRIFCLYNYLLTEGEVTDDGFNNTFILTGQSDHLTLKTAKPPGCPNNVGVTGTTCNSIQLAWDPPQLHGTDILGKNIVLYCIMRPYTDGRLDRYRIGIPRELSEIRTQPWLSEGSLTCDPCHHRGPIF